MKIVFLRISTAVLFLLLIVFMYWNDREVSPLPNNIPCVGTVNYDLVVNDTPVNYTLSHRIVTVSGTSGYDSIKGQFSVDGKSYNVGRTIKFEHHRIPFSNSHEYHVVSTHKSSSDNLPDTLSEKYLTYLNQDSPRFLHLDRIDNQHILISDTSGPSFLCRHG